MSQVDLQVRSRSRAAGLLLCAAVFAAPLAAQAPPEPPAAASPAEPLAAAPAVRLEPAVVPAAGRQAALLEVADFGRYSIRVASARGTALQVVDRMSGAGEIAGEAGKIDGRVDLFLDRGEVRILTHGSKLATGEAALSVTPFRERGGDAATGAAPAVVQLVEGKAVDGELADLEQLSWWMEIPKRRRVVFEAAGRNLADLRLWQNGSWLVDAAPVTSVVEPQAGRPLRLCQLTADLAPGLYRLTAYGGPEVRWSASGVERPFHLRFGWPRDAQTLRERRTIGPLGFDRVLVPAAVDYFRLELPEPPAGEASVELAVATLDEQDPFAVSGSSTTIRKENVPPVAELTTGAGSEGWSAVTIRGAAGQPYVLQHFARTRERELNARATRSEYWISTVHAGPPGDAIEPTAILVRKGDGAKRRSEVIASETVVLSGVAGWARRFNLLDTATLFVKVEQAGTYLLQSRGTAAQFRLEPLFIDAYPDGWQTPPMRSAPAEWQLDPGYYVLFLQPVEAGIAEIELAAKGAPAMALEPPRPSVQLGVVPLSAKLGYHLYVSQQPGVEAGMVVRELPLDLAAALPLALGPGEEVELRIRAAEPSCVRALTEAGGGLEISLDGAAWAGAALGAPESFVDKGEHRLRVRSTSEATVLASVGLVAASQLATAPLPELPAATLAALPAFPRLTAALPQALDLAAGEARTFLVAAEDPALYRIESTGLLATAGALRTRTRANLLARETNGVGRNFALAAYLREGDYQLTVQPRGASAGHLGVEMGRAAIEEAGELTPGVPARAAIDPRRAVSYRLKVTEPGRHTVMAWGLRKSFPLRLEDADGWPVAAPLADGQLTVDLEPGDYRLIVLPQAVTARAVVIASRAADPIEYAGHGPHPLALQVEASHLWLEPEEGAARQPDRWRFTLPAPTGVTIELSDEMMGEIRSISSGEPLPDGGLVPPGRRFHGLLPAGDYELAVEASRSNNRLRYRVSVRTDDLVAGETVAVAAPAELWLSVGAAAQVELSSLGHTDVRATLKTAVGERLASSDDRPGDWNFLLTERLAPGRYRLQVEPVGSPQASTSVSMRVLPERSVEPVAVQAETVRALFEVADHAVVVPLARSADAEIFAVGARAGESLGLALEERVTGPKDLAESWRELASDSGTAVRLALPLAESTGELRLRLWSLDRRPATAEVTLYAGAIRHRSEAELARGFELTELPGIEPRLAAALVDLAEPGCFRREGEAQDAPALLQALALGSTFGRAAPTLAPVGFAMPLAAPLEEGDSVLRVQARRARVGEGEPLALLLPAGTPITCDVADGGAAVVELEAMAGEPVVGFLDGRGTVGPSTAWGRTGGGRVRSAKSAGKGRAVELWNSGAGPVEARLSGWLSASASSERIAWGSGRTVVGAGEVRLLELPAGAKDLRLTLAPGTSVLALAPANEDAEDDSEALLWAPAAAATETLVTRSSRLLVFGGERAPGEIGLELLPRSSAAASPATAESSLTDQRRFEKRFPFAGASRVPVAGPAAGGSGRLHLRGATSALFVGGDGRIQRGADFDVSSAGGSLRFEHRPGLVSAWLDDGGDRPASSGELPPGAPRELTLPATVDLAGSAAHFEVEVAAPALLKLRGTSPMGVAVGSPAVRSEVSPGGAHFDAVLPAGRARISLRALAGEDLTGAVTLVAEPLAPLAEGLGGESLLAPGDSRGFAFHVAKSGPVGVGVSADQGGVETLLFDAGGGYLGQGVVQWAELAAGDYVLVVAAPAEGRPARIRPALVGASPPGNGPPPEEARRFLALAAGEAPAVSSAAGVAGAEDLPADWLGVRAETGDDRYSGDGEDSYSEEGYDDETANEGGWTEESEWSDDSVDGNEGE